MWLHNVKNKRASGIPIGLRDPNGPRGSECASGTPMGPKGAIEVGVLGLKNGRGWRWSVCHSNDGAISEVLWRREEEGGGGRRRRWAGFEIKSNNPNLKGREFAFQ